MLIKRIYILKGNRCSGTLKLKNLEGAYCEVELNAYNVAKRDLCFILKAGSFLLIENLEGNSLKRKIRCIDADNAYSAICDKRSGSIVMWAGETPTPPSFLSELALKQKYPVVKRREEKPVTEEIDNSIATTIKDVDPTQENNVDIITAEDHTIDEKNSEEPTEDNSVPNDENIDATSIEERFGITSISNEEDTKELHTRTEESKNTSEKELPFKLALAKEILEKYHMVEHNSELERLCSDSKWIIETSTEKDFSLGVLFNSDGNPTHVCYAHKGIKNNPPDFSSEWLSDNEINGYWVVYEEIDQVTI